MTKKKTTNKKPNTWRSLKQTGKPRAVSDMQQQARLLRFKCCVGALLAIALLLSGLMGAWHLKKTHPEMFRFTKSRHQLENVILKTDGVIDDHWLRQATGLNNGKPLSDIDIGKLDSRLESYGQIDSATIELHYPHALVVELKENTPIFRVRVAEPGDKEPKDLLVSRKGRVFAGNGQTHNMLNRLPYLVGVELKKRNHVYRAIQKVEDVAPLVETARQDYPELYAQWRFVSLENYDGRKDVPWAVVRIHTRDRGQWLFSPYDYHTQLKRLDKILAQVDPQDKEQITRIDLTHKNRAAVRIARSPMSSRY